MDGDQREGDVVKTWMGGGSADRSGDALTIAVSLGAVRRRHRPVRDRPHAGRRRRLPLRAPHRSRGRRAGLALGRAHRRDLLRVVPRVRGRARRRAEPARLRHARGRPVLDRRRAGLGRRAGADGGRRVRALVLDGQRDARHLEPRRALHAPQPGVGDDARLDARGADGEALRRVHPSRRRQADVRGGAASCSKAGERGRLRESLRHQGRRLALAAVELLLRRPAGLLGGPGHHRPQAARGRARGAARARRGDGAHRRADRAAEPARVGRGAAPRAGARRAPGPPARGGHARPRPLQGVQRRARPPGRRRRPGRARPRVADDGCA